MDTHLTHLSGGDGPLPRRVPPRGERAYRKREELPREGAAQESSAERGAAEEATAPPPSAPLEDSSAVQPDGEDERETGGPAGGGPASAEIELDTGRLVSFELSEEGDEVIILVKDGRTGEVVREIPPEDLRELVEKLEKFSGLFLDRLG